MANTVMCKECKVNKVRCIGLCNNCYARYIYNKNKQRTEISITVIQKGWSAYGGSNNGYNITSDRKEWNCQSCGLEQPAQITAYLFPFEGVEIVRVCPECQNLVIEENIHEFARLIELAR